MGFWQWGLIGSLCELKASGCKICRDSKCLFNTWSCGVAGAAIRGRAVSACGFLD